jgi:Lipase (class 3)
MAKKNDNRYREALVDRSKSSPLVIQEGNENLAANLNFSYSKALQAAAFAKSAYNHQMPLTSLLASMDWSPLNLSSSRLEVSNAYAFAGRREDAQGGVKFALAFEGSNSPFDLVQFRDWTNANLSKYGWSDYYAMVQSIMARMLNEALTAKAAGQEVQLLITGHSLGGAAASVALADLFLPANTSFWPDKNAPLQINDRIYSHPELSKWSTNEIRSLLDDAEAYVFGAPSFLIDPNKLDLLGWLQFGLNLINPKDVVDFFYNLGKTVAEIVVVNETRLPKLSGLENRLFQFEHRNSDALLGLSMDPVAALGTRQAGTEVAINLDDVAYKRYGGNPLSLHSIDNYEQSILKVIAGQQVLRAQDPWDDSGLLLPQLSNGTARNDLLIDIPKAAGLAGNDLLLARSAGTYVFNGGAGEDVYVIAGFGVHVTVSGPAHEGVDSLFFALDGTLSVSRNEDAWVYTMTGADDSSIATVRIQSENGYEVDLVGILLSGASETLTMNYFA